MINFSFCENSKTYITKETLICKMLDSELYWFKHRVTEDIIYVCQCDLAVIRELYPWQEININSIIQSGDFYEPLFHNSCNRVYNS